VRRYNLRQFSQVVPVQSPPEISPASVDKNLASTDSVSGGTLFHEHWWLEVVTQGRYEEVTVRTDDRVVGRLPFLTEKKMGLNRLVMPPFTHVLGPLVDPGVGKPQTQFQRRLSIIRELIDQLPPFASFKQALCSPIGDGLAFQDRGFQVRPQYSFEIDCRCDPAVIWNNMHFKTRQHIRRAEEKFSVATVNDPSDFTYFYQKNLAERGRKSFVPLDLFPHIFSACRERDSGEILSAGWPTGGPTAMAFFVWGRGTMYYLLSTRANDLGDNGSVSLLIWSAIKRAHERGLMFDFDGVSTSGTARFFSGFGGRPQVRTIVEQSSFVYDALRYAKRRLIGGQGEDTTAFT
jgi:Acetyltransferase (GNAT) domain